MPKACAVSEYAQAGGLLSYGPSWPELERQHAGYVDRVLGGANPGDLPIEQPTKFDLTINLTTAQALDLTIPQPSPLHADEVIR